MDFLTNTKKYLIQNRHAFKNATVNTFYVKIGTVHNSKNKLCTGVFIFNNGLK